MLNSIDTLPLFLTARPPVLPQAAKPLVEINARGSFLEIVHQFEAFGARSVEEIVGGIPYLANEFWTARQRQAHSLHEISYRACFKAQLPAFFISNLTNPGDVVYDPFMGRGTTPI